MRTLTTTVILSLALGAIVAPTAAEAHRLSEKRARNAIVRSAEKAAEQTDARTYKIRNCEQPSRHRWQCVVALYYDGDVARCELPVTVRASHQSKKLRRTLGETVCY